MKAIIPVAGIGTRLRPHTYSTPKVLLHVAGKPILAHILDELTALGIDEIVLVIGHLGERIEAYARERYLLQANRELLDLDPPKIPSNREKSRINPPSYVDPAGRN